MPFAEIDPDDPIFRQVRNESITGKLNMTGKFALPGFLQKHEREPYSKPFLMSEQRTVVVQQKKPEPTGSGMKASADYVAERVEAELEKTAFQQPAELLQPDPIPEPVLVDHPRPEQEPIPYEQVQPTATLPQVKVKVPQFAPQNDSVGLYHKKPVFPNPYPIHKKEPAKIEPVAAQPQFFENPIPKPIPSPLPILTPSEYPDLGDVYNTGNRGGFKLPSFRRAPKQQSVNLDTPVKTKLDLAKLKGPIAQAVVGLIVVWFGLTSTGSYFTPASRFSGDLAAVFYGYQLGTLIAIIGAILVYDAIRKAGNI